MKVGLYFGTFNPVHVGHLIIANYMAQETDLDQVWMIVSPQNPLRNTQNLLADHHRLRMVEEAIEDNDLLRVSDVEFKLPKPSYTVSTLAVLEEKHPNYEFTLIMGEDNLRSLNKWRNYEAILKHQIYVYPRVFTEDELDSDIEVKHSEFETHPNVTKVQAPIMKISASFIRKSIAAGKDVRYLLTPEVMKYVDEMNFYRK